MGDWIPLMDYAARTGISLSTLRRHIKSNKIPHRVENGRYLVQLKGSPGTAEPARPAVPSPSRIGKLAAELRKAQEEIAELKTLIAFYEERLGASGPSGGGAGVVRPGPGSPLRL